MTLKPREHWRQQMYWSQKHGRSWLKRAGLIADAAPGQGPGCSPAIIANG